MKLSLNSSESDGTRVKYAIVVLFVVLVHSASEPDCNADELSDRFAAEIRPFMQTYCLGCHGEKRQEAKLKLSGFVAASDVSKNHQVWAHVLERLKAGEMPPEDARQPDPKQRAKVTAWIEAFRTQEANRNAGDPGAVIARRLNNNEYNYTVRDLIGHDIRPTKSFPVDPANKEGFDNSGESLTTSPALLGKYLDAARFVAEHAVLTPSGIDFAPHPTVTKTDRDKYCVKRIVQFYRRQPTDLADYFFAAWQFRFRQQLGRATETPNATAKRNKVSAKYLKTVLEALQGKVDDNMSTGPLGRLRSDFAKLPVPSTNVEAVQEVEVKQACRKLRDQVAEFRERIEPTFPNLYVDGSHRGSQPFVLWKNRQYANQRRKFISVDQEKQLKSAAGKADPRSKNNKNKPRERKPLDYPGDPAARNAFIEDVNQFCSVFPDAFYVAERGRDYLGTPKDKQEKGRLLSAGFHSMMGYFRDDKPLYDMILDREQQRELDRLWQELDFVAFAPIRQYSGFLWFERTDSRYLRDPVFDFARAEDKSATTEKMIRDLSRVYIEKAKTNGGTDIALKAIDRYFSDINHQIRWVERERRLSEPKHIEALLSFARRAFRRKLELKEKQDLRAFYQAMRKEGLSHEDAVQDTLVSILMSPHFMFRMELAASSEKTVPLTSNDLANRLSYFLWSTMPDDQLLTLAEQGKLTDDRVLTTQIDRMLGDGRIRALVVEFGLNWLDIRRFHEHNSVDRKRYPSFTDELRDAMREEPIQFFLDVVRQDRSIKEFLRADHTFVNAVLATHYGIPFNANTDAGSGVDDKWIRVADAGKYGRGGLLPMAVFLTKNSPGLRTSPVKRGYWVVRRVLGETIPPPPPNVPELPEDEAKLGELSLRETLAKHREHKSCAVCHDRFDAMGLVFENYDPIGALRTKDGSGRRVDTNARFPNGSEGRGLSGLVDYVSEHREQDFVDSFARKLLSYALGRSLLLSDEPLLADIKKELSKNGFKFSIIIKRIAASKQFRMKRG